MKVVVIGEASCSSRNCRKMACTVRVPPVATISAGEGRGEGRRANIMSMVERKMD
jgi:hypothetical protein